MATRVQMYFFPLMTAIVMGGFGVHALWLNPKRATNQVMALICLLSAMVFVTRCVGYHFTEKWLIDHTANPLPWVRLRFATIGIMGSFLVWLCYYIVSGRYTTRRNLFYKLLPWIGVSLVLGVLPFTDTPIDYRREHLHEGPRYHTGQVFLSLVQRALLLTLVAVPAAYVIKFLLSSEADAFAATLAVVAACVAFWYLDDKLRSRLNLKAEQQTGALSKELQQVWSTEPNPEILIEHFERILSARTYCPRVRILRLDGSNYVSGDLVIPTSACNATLLLTEGWVSVVSISRLPRTTHDRQLLACLQTAALTLLVCPKWTDTEPSLLIAFGERENNLPFTHPEIRVLRGMAEAVDTLYTRTRFALQARQAEQLATIGLVGAGLAHELRNPIVSISTFAQLLPRRLDDVEFLRDFAEILPSEAARIQALAEQLLNLAKPREYRFLRTDVHVVLAETNVLLTQRAQEAGCSIVAAFEAVNHEIIADPDALKQILVNLIVNGIQSIAETKRPGKVTVRTKETERQFVIEVEDTGAGIPERIRGSLFKPFATTSKQDGLGLGLAICTEIAKAHRGTISAHETESGGALFRVSLPTQLEKHPVSTRS